MSAIIFGRSTVLTNIWEKAKVEVRYSGRKIVIKENVIANSFPKASTCSHSKFVREGYSMGNKKIGAGLMFNLIGAMFAYLIGSGFASGQEIMQYFSGWGSVWQSAGVGIIAIALSYLAYVAYSYAGRTRGLADLGGVFNFYAGNVFGKLFQAFAWLFNACCYVFMISGFGATLHQQWGLAAPIGCAIGVVLSVGTAVLGLNRIVDIIGKIGPAIVALTLIVGVAAAFTYYPQIASGNELINSGAVAVTRAGANWWLAGLSYAGCNLLLVSAFIGTMGHSLREYRFRYNKMIVFIGAIGIMGVAFLLGLSHIGNVANAVQVSIPNLLLANTLFGNSPAANALLSTVFAVVILLGVYTTICPMLWTCVSMVVKNEKSIRYKLTCAGAGVAVYFITLFVPYETLLNYIMTYCGYTGAIVAVVVIARYYIIKAKDKKSGVLIDGTEC